MNDQDLQKYARMVSSWMRPPKEPIEVSKVEVHDGVTVVYDKDGAVALFGADMAKAIKKMTK